MVYQTLSYGIMNSSLLVEMREGSIYHEGVQNTMTKNLPQGQNTIWKIEPGVKYHMKIEPGVKYMKIEPGVKISYAN